MCREDINIWIKSTGIIWTVRRQSIKSNKEHDMKNITIYFILPNNIFRLHINSVKITNKLQQQKTSSSATRCTHSNAKRKIVIYGNYLNIFGKLFSVVTTLKMIANQTSKTNHISKTHKKQFLKIDLEWKLQSKAYYKKHTQNNM